MAATRPRPARRTKAERPCAARPSPRSSIFTNGATAPPTSAVIATPTSASTAAFAQKPIAGMAASAMHMIFADRTSVRSALSTFLSSRVAGSPAHPSLASWA